MDLIGFQQIIEDFPRNVTGNFSMVLVDFWNVEMPWALGKVASNCRSECSLTYQKTVGDEAAEATARAPVVKDEYRIVPMIRSTLYPTL